VYTAVQSYVTQSIADKLLQGYESAAHHRTFPLVLCALNVVGTTGLRLLHCRAGNVERGGGGVCLFLLHTTRKMLLKFLAAS